MPLVKWDPVFEVGIATIDNDHRLLVGLLNELSEAIDGAEDSTVVGSVLFALADYVRYHFIREERALKMFDDPTLTRHTAMHEAMRKKIEDLVAKFIAEPAQFDPTPLRTTMHTWIVDHVMRADRELARLACASDECLAIIEDQPLVDMAAIERAAMAGEGGG